MKILGDRDIEERRLNKWVGLTFLVGVAISLALIVVGFIILFIITGTGNIQPLVRLDQIPAAIVISIGILLLLLIPIIQVITSIVVFSIARDRLFAGIAVAAFCLASISLVLALT